MFGYSSEELVNFPTDVLHVDHDNFPAGNSIVIEYVKGQLNIYDNPFGVITNASEFDSHLANIKNYLNLSTSDVGSRKLAGETFTIFGQGSALFCIPGDFTPPSRFIRVLFFTLSYIETKNAQDNFSQLFHVLSSFDIPKGSVREKNSDVTHEDYTPVDDRAGFEKQGLLLQDGKQQSDQGVVHLLKCNLDAKKISGFKMETPHQDVLDVTPELK